MNDVWGINTWLTQAWGDCWGYPAPTAGHGDCRPRIGTRVLRWVSARIGGARAC